MEALQKNEYPDAMRIGIGTKEEARALGELQCDQVISSADLSDIMSLPILPFRADAGDVAVVLNPKTLTLGQIKRIVEVGVPIEVAGHEPKMPRTYEERRQLRALTAFYDGEEAPDGRGRPKVYDTAEAHVHAAIQDWHAGEYVDGRWKSTYTPAGVMERARLRTGLPDLPKHWARNVVIAHFGSAVRNPDDLPKEDQ